MGIMQGLRKKDRHKDAATQKPAAAEATPLIFLVPDAQGIATYQMHSFPSARAAEIYVDVTLRGQVNDGAVAFWALTWQPAAEHYAEPLVVIRDADRPIVYLFSFADLHSCHDFIRHEMTRGLELHQVMIYWAVPASVGLDFWGRAAVTPAAAPQHAYAAAPPTPEPEMRAEVAEPAPAAVLPFAAREANAPARDRRYLTEADIAETVREMNDFAARFDAERAPVIDFPSASQKIRGKEKATAAVTAWANFAQTLDEALDVYAARQVRVRLAINRVTRALTEAAVVHATSMLETKTGNGNGRRPDVAAAWANAAIALADAATIAIRRALMRRVWMNTAWTLEEASYAHRLETRARAMRAWRFASRACDEAAKARIARDARVVRAWQNAGAAISEAHAACEARRKALEAAAVAVWSVLSTELLRAAEAQLAGERASFAWKNAGTALTAAGKAHIKRQKMYVRAWTRIARALKQAIAAETKQRKPIEKAQLAAVRAAERAEKAAARAEARAAKKAERAESPKKRWEPHEEPFQGFRSPPGRF